MLWIDGDRRYDAVHLDFALWEPHLVGEGGILAMHDTIRKRAPAIPFSNRRKDSWRS